eukprot:CAMPEP_0202693938 /NCGR_PEP_ID=MMETSP1385-20130828/7932_1 /ASSEMBLY_ACC=CAM_ASM_000861 /TAXON_ID=933848 /ORGANISM="Elphidium margaritaceum" /LENGTH=95 /DNA_ID=CAMNT_0049349701 /DNA_START=331 /DNA_END=618 /DNA_ORIENTATION=+
MQQRILVPVMHPSGPVLVQLVPVRAVQLVPVQLMHSSRRSRLHYPRHPTMTRKDENLRYIHRYKRMYFHGLMDFYRQQQAIKLKVMEPSKKLAPN